MALISEKKFTINPTNGNGCGNGDNQYNYYSQTSLLNTRIEFKSSKEHSSDESSDEEDISTQLKSKYHVLLPDTSSDKVKHFYTNGVVPVNKLKQTNTIQEAEKSRDGNELGQSKQILYPRDKIVLEWKRMNRIGSGLANLGNTCFMNSVLQCLTYCPPLVNYFSSIKDEHSSKCRQSFCMMCLMMKHIENALTRTSQVIKPVYICQRLKSIAKHFTFGRQEDAHEFLRYVIDHMWRSCLSVHEQELGIAGTASKFDHLTKSTTAINQIFGGYHRSQVLCLQCKEKSNTYDYFMDFMLDIQNVSSLEEALQKFVAPEILKNDNAYKCSKCKKSVVAKKQFTVHLAPNVATFQFKRFDCSRMFGKISKPVSYPERLNLRPYMSEKGPPLMYKLISVLVHLGSSSNSGHYFCYVRNSNNSWFLMDDSHVSQVNLNEVLSQKAYVLLYNRLSADCILQNSNKLTPQSPQMNLTPQQKLTVAKVNSSQQFQNQQNKYFNSTFKFTPTSEKALQNFHSDGNSGKTDSTQKINSVSTSPLRLNLSGNRHPQNSLSPTKKATLLVPYGKDSDDEKDSSTDSDKYQQTVKTPKLQQESCLVVNGQNQTAQNKQSCGPSNQVKNNEVTKEKDPIPILKVKATTNSWQVVESTSNIKTTEDKNFPKMQSNWKISKSTDSFSYDDKKSTNGNVSYSNFNEKSKDNFLKAELKNKDHSDKEKFHKKNKEKKRKRKRKDKDRLKKREHLSDSEEEPEYKWVERTKETLELENKNEKRKLSYITDGDDFETKKRIKPDDSSKKSADTLDVLLKGATHGYGDNVKSWDGGVSNLNRVILEDKRSNSFNDDDEYNEEFDQGKVKKVKKLDKVDLFQNNSIKNNPFQRMQYKYMNGLNENNYSRNLSVKSSKFDNKHELKSNGKFGNDSQHHKEKYFDKHKDRFTYGNGHNSNHYRSNSGSSYKMKNQFKCR